MGRSFPLTHPPSSVPKSSTTNLQPLASLHVSYHNSHLRLPSLRDLFVTDPGRRGVFVPDPSGTESPVMSPVPRLRTPLESTLPVIRSSTTPVSLIVHVSGSPRLLTQYEAFDDHPVRSLTNYTSSLRLLVYPREPPEFLMGVLPIWSLISLPTGVTLPTHGYPVVLPPYLYLTLTLPYYEETHRNINLGSITRCMGLYLLIWVDRTSPWVLLYVCHCVLGLSILLCWCDYPHPLFLSLSWSGPLSPWS